MECNHKLGQRCETVEQHIREYLDPNGVIVPDDDPEEVVSWLDEVFANEGGSGVTVEEMRAYIETR